MDLLDLLPLLLKTAPAVQAGMKGVDLKQQAETSNEINQLARAQANPSGALFQSMLAENTQAGQSNLAHTIAQLQAQNRIAQSNGQRPLLDAERGGESIFRNLIKGQEDVEGQAYGQTTSQIQSALAGLHGAYDTQNNLSSNQFQNTVKKVGAYGSISDALQGLFGLKKPETINWNQGGTSVLNNSTNSQQSYTNPMSYLNPQQPISLLPVNGGFQSTGGGFNN